jgi:hypothetical protein
MAGALELLDGLGQLRPVRTATLLGFENARAQELRNVLQFVGGEALQKSARVTPLQFICARAERAY